MEQNTQAVLGPVERMVRRLDPKRAVVERVTDADIARAFDGTNFGRTDHKHLLALSVLKKALRYHCGHTITQIMVRMGLTTEKGRVTEKGRATRSHAGDVSIHGDGNVTKPLENRINTRPASPLLGTI